MNLPAPSDRTFQGQPLRIAAPLAVVIALALPGFAFGQQTPSGGDDTDAAMRNIQNNFAHMSPAPRTIDTINQELKQSAAARPHGGGGGGGGGFGQRGGGRHGRQASQQDKSDSGSAGTPAPSATPPDSSALSNGSAPQ